MITYAGIGSRNITDKERITIEKLSNELSKKYIVMSGNAEGADIAFQTGSNNKCVLLVPWKNFNRDKYSHDRCLAKFDVGDTPEGNESIDKFHPSPKSLTMGGRRMMARNYHQIMGYDIYPKVSFVICCANRDEHGAILGGTGQAVRLAKSLYIPVINIRDGFWLEDLKTIIKDIK